MLSSIVEQSFGRGGKNAAIARFPAFCVTTPSTAPPMTPPMIGTARVIAIDAPRCAPRCANFVAAARVNRHEAFCIAVPLARIAAYCTPSRTPAPTLATSSNSSLALPALPSAAAIAFAATDGSSGSFPAKIASASASRSDVNVVAASCAGIAIGSVNTPPNPATPPLPKFCAVARARSASPLRNSASVVSASSSSTSRGRCALASALALDTRVPDSANVPYDIRTVIETVVDDGDFLEVQPLFAPNLVIGYGRVEGRSVGIVGNQPMQLAGCLDIDASEKAARFVRTCDAFNIPVLTFVDVPGFLPGTEQEWNGIIRRGAKLIYAYAEATVPLVTIITRKAYGGAYDVMGSKHLGADVNLSWPTGQIAVVGASGAVNILYRKEVAAAEDPDAKRAELITEYEDTLCNPYIAAERGYIDAVIEPSQTRAEVTKALRLLKTKRETLPPKKHGNIPL